MASSLKISEEFRRPAGLPDWPDFQGLGLLAVVMYRFRANGLGVFLVAVIELRVYPTRGALRGLVSVVDRSDRD